MCKSQLAYLMQLYAPIDEYPQAYHRVLYVFYCNNPKCARSGKEVKVVRAQCASDADIYKPKKIEPEKPKEEVPTTKPAAAESLPAKAPVPSVEEDKGEPVAAAPKEETKKSKHKKKRKKGAKPGQPHAIDVATEKADVSKHYAARISQILSATKDSEIPEDEKEDITALLPGAKETKYEKELLKQYEQMEHELSVEDKEALDLEVKDIEEQEFEKEKHKDHYFGLFQWVSLQTPNQVLRYARHFPGVQPLWYRKEGVVRKEQLAKCKNCGGELVFEFQIMPQLFNFVPALAKVDWATIIVYTY